MHGVSALCVHGVSALCVHSVSALCVHGVSACVHMCYVCVIGSSAMYVLSTTFTYSTPSLP